jgi:signal transduction histidine kinase
MNATWTGIRDCLLESQETERQRLAQELHDGSLQELHSLDFGLMTLARHLEGELAISQWSTIRTTLQSVSRQLRTLCQDLRPPALGPFGLSAVLYSYAENFQLLYPDMTVGLDLAEDNQQLPQSVRVTFYRICQQALRNVAQHANAQNVHISLQLNNGQVTMTVEDDGAGFAVPEAWLEWARQGRFGLFEAFQRAAAIGGNLEVDSQPDRGVRLRVTAPLARAEHSTSSPCNE